MIEQLQNEGKLDKNKLSSTNDTFIQQKMVEDELRGNIEKLQFKLKEINNTLRTQSEEYHSRYLEISILIIYCTTKG